MPSGFTGRDEDSCGKGLEIQRNEPYNALSAWVHKAGVRGSRGKAAVWGAEGEAESRPHIVLHSVIFFMYLLILSVGNATILYIHSWSQIFEGHENITSQKNKHLWKAYGKNPVV